MKTYFDNELAHLKENDANFTYLNLKNCEIVDDKAKDLAETLKENTTLATIFLQFNQIGPLEANYIADAISVNQNLEHFYLVDNPIGNEGGESFAYALNQNNSLKSICLSGVEIGSLKSIAESLLVNTTLQSLQLTRNKINQDGAELIIAVLQENTVLKKLDLSSNEIKINDRLAELMATVLKENNSIQTLKLRETQITKTAKEILVTALKNNYTLLELQLDAGAEFTEYLQRNKNIASCLRLLYEAINTNNFPDRSTLQKGVEILYELVPEIDALAKDNYIVEAKDLLVALYNINRNSYLSVLERLLVPFKYEPFQDFADLLLGSILCGDFHKLLKEIDQEQEGLLLILYCFRNNLDNPEIWNCVNRALFKLINKAECTSEEELEDFEENTKLLSQDKFLDLIERALANFDNEIDCYEKLSLKHLLKTPSDELTFPIASKSPTFIKTCQSHYPNAESFTTIEHCLFSNTRSFLIDLNSESAKTLSDLVDSLKQTLKKTISEELSEATESSEETLASDETASNEETSSSEEIIQNTMLESTSIKQEVEIEKRQDYVSFFNNKELNNQSDKNKQDIQNGI